MSTWLDLVNELKRRNVDELLTPTQREISDRICSLLDFPQRLNLWGPTGCGKTFVAWAIARNTGAMYVPSPERLSDKTAFAEIIIVDNAPTSEGAVRTILATCNLLEARSVILVTKWPIDMPMRRMQMGLPSEDELAIASKNISRLGFYPQPGAQSASDFWTLLRNHI